MTRFRTGRILPDVMGGQPAAEQIKLEADERADEDRSTKRSNVKGDARPRQPRAAVRPVAKHLSSSEDTRIGAIPPVPSPEESKPPRANVRPAEGGETASTMMPAGNRIEAVEQHHERAKDKRVLSGAQRRAKRHGLPVPFKRGERWKRHLPQVCW